MNKRKSTLNVLFVYPPFVGPTIPPISHSRLKPSIPASWDVEFLDENILFVYHVISIILGKGFESWPKISSEKYNKRSGDNYILAIYSKERSYKNHQKMENGSTAGRFDDNPVNNSLIPLKDDILKSIAILKSKLFFDIKHYVAANSVLEYLFAKFSQIYYPSEIGYANIKLMYSPYYSEEVKRSLEDENKNPFIDFFSSRINEYGYRDIIAISVIYSSQIIAAITLAKLYYERYPDSLIILGGPALFHIIKNLESKFNFIDLIVPLDGEYFLKNCVNQIKQIFNRRYEKGKIKNLINLDDCSGFYNLDGPIPDYSFVSFDKYLLAVPVVSLDITRGCYYRKCVFCAYGFDIAPYRVMPVESVLRTIKDLKERFNINNFLFSVDVIDPNYLSILSEKIINSGIKINYYLDARMERRFADKDFGNKLAKSGCRVISFGMESACKRTLLRMKKGIEPRYFEDTLSNLYDRGIHINLNIIHGFPGESSEEIQKTLEFLFRNKRYITTVGVSEFTLLRGSLMEKNYRDFGINSIMPEGDLHIWYNTDYKYPIDYPNFEYFLKQLITIFPIYGRLTGSTSDYLLYASNFSPSEMKLLLEKAIRLKIY